MEPKGHILVVDDDEFVRSFATRALTMNEYHVTACADGLEGVEKYREIGDAIDMVILDMVMPNMSGDKCFYELQKIDSTVPIVVASGFDRNSAIATLVNDGAVGYLHKPFRINQVTKIFKDLI